MCISAFALLAATTAVSVLGQIKQGQQQQEMYNVQAQQQAAQADAQVVQNEAEKQQILKDAAYSADATKAQAEKIRRAGRFQVGEANASLAASGVKLGQGTALEIRKNINQNVEEDALSAVLSGKRTLDSAQTSAQRIDASSAATLRNSQIESGLLAKAGSNAVTNSYFGAASTVLSSAPALGKGWKTRAKGFAE